MPTERVDHFDQLKNDEELLLNLDLLDEKIEMSQLRLVEYQNKMARHYNTRVRPRSFQVGHLILHKVQRHVDVLDPTWKGSFEVKGVIHPGTYMLANLEVKLLPHPWNVKHLKHYYP